jgi:hypothetical protein
MLALFGGDMADEKEEKNPHALALSALGASKGGLARAEKLSPERKKEIAAAAAKARWAGHAKPAKASHVGELKIGDLVIPCAVLEDGTRVISQRGFWGSLAAGNPRRGRGSDNAFVLPAFLSAKSLRPFISEELATSLTSPVPYTGTGHKGGGPLVYGMKAELIPQICDVWLKAREAGELHHSQRSIAKKAEVLVRGLARVGIVALVDEATGYQYDRARTALAEILEQFISKNLAAWARQFPDDYYEQLFRLRKWEFDPESTKRPVLVGTLTKNLVYSRLAPGVLDELERLNPRRESGHRSARHHQWLTKDVGHPKLKEHLTKLVVLMQAADSWDELMSKVNKVLPKQDLPLLQLMAKRRDEAPVRNGAE